MHNSSPPQKKLIPINPSTYYIHNIQTQLFVWSTFYVICLNNIEHGVSCSTIAYMLRRHTDHKRMIEDGSCILARL